MLLFWDPQEGWEIHGRSSNSTHSYYSDASSFSEYRIKGACWIALGALQLALLFHSQVWWWHCLSERSPVPQTVLRWGHEWSSYCNPQIHPLEHGAWKLSLFYAGTPACLVAALYSSWEHCHNWRKLFGRKQISRISWGVFLVVGFWVFFT